MRSRRFSLAVSAALAVLFLALLVARPEADAAPVAEADASVAIANFAFNPGTITVPAGTATVWGNQDGEAHTSTSDAGLWDSGVLEAGQSFSLTLTALGVFPYHCEIHPFMRGTVVVTAAEEVQQDGG